MPRRSAASLTVTPLDASPRRIKPPATLPAPIKELWTAIVESLPATHFHKSDVSLLTLYCRAVHQATLAFKNIERCGAFDDEAQNPAVRVADTSVKQAATLAAKLRLCPSARLDRTVAGKNARRDHAAPKPWNFEEPA